MTADATPAAGPPPDPAGITVVHLVRHGEVANPRGVIYGRLPGYHLSADGQLMAKAAADYLADRDVVLLRCSPLDRAVETAAPIGQQFGLEPEIDERLIEPWNYFEGMTFGVGDGSLRKPRHWKALCNPFRPSWGEPYREVAARMLAAATDAARAARGHEAVCVSHQLPIWVTRLAVERLNQRGIIVDPVEIVAGYIESDCLGPKGEHQSARSKDLTCHLDGVGIDDAG